MNKDDITVGMQVRLDIDPARFPADDYAYLRREGKYGEGKYLALGPTIDGTVLTVFDILPDGVRLILPDGRLAYLAKPNELSVA